MKGKRIHGLNLLSGKQMNTEVPTLLPPVGPPRWPHDHLEDLDSAMLFPQAIMGPEQEFDGRPVYHMARVIKR